MALLHYYKKSVRPFKCGPDFIDPQFHERVAQTPSVNLDAYMMNKKQVKWIYAQYFDKDVAIVEGVMGYYDGMDKGSSAYDIANILELPSLLVVDAGGSYITISAVLQGMSHFRNNARIQGVILNRVSSEMHYALIKKHIEKELPELKVCGWIQKSLKSLASTHLGLDLQELDGDVLENVAEEVLENIDIKSLESIMDVQVITQEEYPFEPPVQKDALCIVVKDKNFSFLYYDNLQYLKELYKDVVLIKSTEDEKIPDNAELVIIPGGYIETDASFQRVKNSHKFKSSLKLHSLEKQVYAECAGLVYLGESCDEKKMSGILPVYFAMTNKRERLGYYRCELDNKEIKGHAFHYTTIVDAPKTDIKLYKLNKKNAKDGGYRYKNVFGTYLHTMWRVQKPF